VLGNLLASKRPLVMGILNVTPDSFSDGGQYRNPDDALRQAERMIEAGADVLDIGGESSRPGATLVDQATERQRVVPAIRAIRRRFDIPLSIDTVKSSVAEAALEAGANWINDISALRHDLQMAPLAARADCPLVLMHRAGTPPNNYLDFHYDDLLAEIEAFFQERIAVAVAAGIRKENVVLDPGIGFGKSAVHNCQLLRSLSVFKKFNRPLLVGTSRKSFIGKLLGVPLERRLPSTIASNLIAVQNGADIVRVHDVAEVRQALMLLRYLSETPKRCC